MSADGVEPGARELEELLRRAAPEGGDPRRREEARRAFLAAGEIPAAAASHPPGLDRMNRVMVFDEHDGFVGWLAACAPAEPVQPEARQRARLAFLSAVASVPSALRRERRSFRALVLTLAAAAILAVTFLLPEPARWSVRLDGPLLFAGGTYAPGDEARLAAELERSGALEATGGRARFSLGGGELVVELLPGASLSFPTLPELDGISPLRFALTRGEAYVRTSSAYAGNPIVLQTPLLDVALEGTVVGVLVGDGGTCVCVAEGVVRVTSVHIDGSQEVGQHSTLRLFGADHGLTRELFPEDEGPESEHTRALVEFGAGR